MTSNTSSPGETQRLDTALANAMRLVWNVLEQLTVSHRLSMITRCRAILDAVESQAIASQINAGVPTRKIEDMLHRSSAGRSSKKTVKKKALRGATVRDNPALGKKMAAGELSDEQVDVIADASAKTGGEAACDTNLISKIAAAPPEQGQKLADEYVRERLSQDDIDTAHERARKRRRVKRYSTDRGTDVLLIEGSPFDIDKIETRIDHLAEQFYRQDGGRDVDITKHRRTRDQRRFDAAHTILSGEGAQPHAPPTERESAKAPQASWKTTIVIRASLEQAMGTEPSPLTLADGTQLPTAVAERLACGADFVGQIFGADGAILWQGRNTRDATYAQRIALAVRDGGCVRCTAPLSRCVVHHLLPWTSRLQGETNIDEMAMVCNDCHHHIHDNHLTLFQDTSNVWRLRRATPEEIAPSRPPRKSTNPRRQSAISAGRFSERETGKSPRSSGDRASVS